MVDWKAKLYGEYVSTGQAGGTIELQEQLSLSSFPHLRRMIERHFPAERACRIADLGCGHGLMIYCLRALGYQNVEGVDGSIEQVAMAHQLGIDEVRHGDLMDYLRNRTVRADVLVLRDVLEHLNKQEVMDLLELAERTLADNGRVIIHVPNGEGLFGMRVRYGDFTHEVCFTQQSIRQVLLASGFRRVYIYEDKPVVHGFKSLIRLLLWEVLTLRERLLLFVETGEGGHILSQNMLVVAFK